MDGRISPVSTSSSCSATAGGKNRQLYCGRRSGKPAAEEEEENGDDERMPACTGKRCQSCTAGVIADCVAVCCCPCAVVNILTLAFVKLPWAVARRCIERNRRRRRRRKRILQQEDQEKTKCGNEEEIDSVVGMEAAGEGGVFRCGGAAVGEEEVWWELYEVGHLGFGRVSFTGISFPNRGN